MRPQLTHDNHLPLKQACVLIARTGYNVKIVYEIEIELINTELAELC